MLEPGDVVLADIQFADSFEVKKRPAVVLYGEYGNVVVAGITSNPNARGIALTTKDGAVKDSVIKLNYIYTLSEAMVEKKLFRLSAQKKIELHKAIVEKLSVLSR